MRVIIDTETKTLSLEKNGALRELPLYCDEAFEIISHEWVKVGWNQKYPYTFSWLGRPIIQLPEDLMRVQEVIYSVKPDVIIETGVAHGGSLVFYASLCKAINKGRVIGVDIEIRPHNRRAIESHELFPLITLIEGSSTDPQIVSEVKSKIRPDETVMVILDSCHTKEHVSKELDSYHPLVSKGSYLVAADGVMRFLHEVPRGNPEWKYDNPVEAVLEFVERHPQFVVEQPCWPFNESTLKKNITHWDSAFLRRV